MIEVGYDDQIFRLQRRGGISRYFTSMICRFRADTSFSVKPVLGWRFTQNRHAVDAGLGSALSIVEQLPRGRGRIYAALNSATRRDVRTASVVHHTYYRADGLRVNRGAKMVTTIHDMIPELLPGLFDRNPHLAKAEYVKRSDLIICVSEATRRDLLEILGPPEEKVKVVHLGVGETFSPNGPSTPLVKEPFVLFVGGRRGYKDFDVALRSFARARTRFAYLIAVGGGPLSTDEQDRIQRLGIAGRVIQLDATEPQLRALYRSASVFVFPSRYEGFGLPTLEAMASGCPVILADSSSHPEVGGRAALYFPPGDHEMLADTLARVSEDVALRSSLRVAGLQRASRFTWSRTAAKTAGAYLQLVDPHQDQSTRW